MGEIEDALDNYSDSSLSFVQDKGEVFQFKVQRLQEQGPLHSQFYKGREQP